MTAQKTRIMPYKGTSHARLSELIEKSQPQGFPLFSQLGFKYMEPVLNGPEGATSIVMTLSVGNAYRSGDIEITYNRLPLDVVKELPLGEILGFENVVFPTSTHRILDKINHSLGLDLTVDEVEDVYMEQAPNMLPITITPASMLWLPGTYYFNMYEVPADGRVTESGNLRITNAKRIRIISVKPQT